MIKEIKKYLDDLKNSDLKRIKVTSGGDFFMSSEEIFNDKDESLKLINSLRQSVINYKIKTRVNIKAEPSVTLDNAEA